ncbi:MAG: nitroreductase family protein [Candidatus Alcyoniella australis]|nr:nitroreductase family protein [Candidatus Alcyoniella australis]
MSDKQTTPAFEHIVEVRRSFRKYSKQPIDPQHWELLEQVVCQACRSLHLNSVSFVFARDPQKLGSFRRAAFSGLMGKVNPWLLTCAAPGYVVVAGDATHVGPDPDNPLYLAQAALAMEALVLQATELGLATCWLGGFGERGLSRLLDLPESKRLVAVTPIGYPPPRGPSLTWDYLAHSVVSKRRLALEKILHLSDRG